MRSEFREILPPPSTAWLIILQFLICAYNLWYILCEIPDFMRACKRNEHDNVLFSFAKNFANYLSSDSNFMDVRESQTPNHKSQTLNPDTQTGLCILGICCSLCDGIFEHSVIPLAHEHISWSRHLCVFQFNHCVELLRQSLALFLRFDHICQAVEVYDADASHWWTINCNYTHLL